ncbi:MAG: hypothetical protein UV07_C0003G0002 [Candidatus Azambacteria bacterium GW2011_GWB1_42_17]|uniref:Uncharacterized protein n=1 Tax=Candidatus Azambacteria bacterium GW2011_GWB1_42_17 TaxID=1618615 RepID=A0A0G0Z7Q6_9BACT|nr:MAG: hypothetical protein UV07_C0003G0002 [Candidatus Azambacteria bacterium GW2011_GWB1_42_17]
MVLITIWVAMAIEAGLLLTQHYGRADQLANYIFIAFFIIGIWRLIK